MSEPDSHKNIFDPSDSICTIIDWLNQGKLLAYPTESVWGIGCDAMNEQAVRQILAIKNRPIEKGMIVVTDCLERIEPFLSQLSNSQRALVMQSWVSFIPSSSASSTKKRQATTWLLPVPKDIGIPKWITGEHNSLAIRVIAHPLIQQVCSGLVSASNPFGFLISTSCNPAGDTPAQTLEQAQDYFAHYDKVAYLSGQTLGYSLPSQIKDGLTAKIVR